MTTRAQININVRNIDKNITATKKVIGNDVGIILVGKSDCMGFGLLHCSKVALRSGVDMIAVSEIWEAKALREASITAPILLLYQPLSEEIETLIELNVILSISNIETAKTIIETATKLQKPVSVDLFLETGMHRYGILEEYLVETIKLLKACPFIQIKSVSSHFATSDSDLDYAEVQMHQFLKGLEIIASVGVQIEMVHFANSAAVQLFQKSWNTSTYNQFFPTIKPYIRVCRTILGASPVQTNYSLLPVLSSITTSITDVQNVKKGEYIGYDKSYKADRDISVATLPIGWGNSGYIFQKGAVIINGVRCPMIGYPSANALSVENIPLAPIGTTVFLIKQDGDGEQFSLEDLAQMNNITQTHITSFLGCHIPKVYSDNIS